MEVDREPQFAPGQLVKHQNYGYRGVVVDFDMTCMADEMWYYQNQTQPPRNQPWYHVLVHESMATTYAAQTSLEADDSAEPVSHPLLGKYFTGFAAGRHKRSDARIQGWET